MKETTLILHRSRGQAAALVLIIAESPLVLRLLKSICRRTRRNAVVVPSFVEALTAARELRPDLILMDVSSDEDGGLESARLLSRNSPAPMIALIREDGETLRELAGIREVIPKGTIALHLEAAMKRCMGL